MYTLKLFWFSTSIVNFQRKLIMTLFSQVPKEDLEFEANQIDEKIATHPKNILQDVKERYSPSKIYLVTHCPTIIAEKICYRFNLAGEFSIPIFNYFAEKKPISNFNKATIIEKLKSEFPEEEILYIADDLIDLEGLKSAHKGILKNGSSFTKFIIRAFNPQIEIWD